MEEFMKKILVAGDIMLDSYCFGNTNRISPEAPVPVLLTSNKDKSTPGGASNVAVNIAAIGVETDLFASIGDDANGKILIEKIEEALVGVKYIMSCDSRPTTTKLRYIAQNNQQILRVDSEETNEIDIDAIRNFLNQIIENINEYGLILLSDYKKGFLSRELTKELIRIGAEYNIPVIVDVKDTDYRKYFGSYLLKPNKNELEGLTGKRIKSKDDAIAASLELCNKANCKYVLTTLGADGMIVCDKDGLISSVNTVAKDVFDVTGAGDTSIAYLAAELLAGKDIVTAMKISNFAAGVQVSKVGTSIVYPTDVQEAMKRDYEDNSLIEVGNNDVFMKIKQSKKANKKIVFTNGCFDILHAGHVTYLKKARMLGDLLVVGINSDESVRRLKGEERPVNTLLDREIVLSSLGFVDYVIPFEEDTPYELISKIVPDVLVKGGDYNIEDIVGRDIVEANGGIVTTIPLVEGKSTTNIINRMKEQ